MSDVEVEKLFRIYQSEGYHHEIGLDPDGLDMVEIRYIEDKDTKPRSYVALNEEQLAAAIPILQELLADMKTKREASK